MQPNPISAREHKTPVQQLNKSKRNTDMSKKTLHCITSVKIDSGLRSVQTLMVSQAFILLRCPSHAHMQAQMTWVLGSFFNHRWVTFSCDLIKAARDVSSSAIFPWRDHCWRATQIPRFSFFPSFPDLCVRTCVCVRECARECVRECVGLLQSPEWWHSEAFRGEPSRAMPS